MKAVKKPQNAPPHLHPAGGLDPVKLGPRVTAWRWDDVQAWMRESDSTGGKVRAINAGGAWRILG